MSTQQKPRGGQDSQLTKLKQLPAGSREVIWGWRDESADGKPLTNAAIRNRIATQFGIRLSRDGQLSSFWSWQHHQQRLENYNVLLENFEEFYRKQKPEASASQVREAGVSFFMAEALANQDRQGFSDIANLHLRELEGKTKAGFDERKISLAEAKFKDSLRDKLQAGLEEIATAFKGNPEAMKLYQQARAMISRATK
jgi:hypothetical protein